MADPVNSKCIPVNAFDVSPSLQFSYETKSTSQIITENSEHVLNLLSKEVQNHQINIHIDRMPYNHGIALLQVKVIRYDNKT